MTSIRRWSGDKSRNCTGKNRVGLRWFFGVAQLVFEQKVLAAILLPMMFSLAASAAPPQWHVLETPRFTVVSQISEKETRAWADEFNQFIGSLSGALKINERLLPKLSVVLFARNRDFKPYLPTQPNGKPWAVAGYFARQETWAAIGLAEQLGDAETRRTIFHEGVHWIVSVYPRYLPLCINEGLAEVYSTFEAKKDSASWGKPIAMHVDYLNRGGQALMPIDQLLLTSSGNSLFNEEERVGVFYAESWAFVHYLMFGQRQGSKSALDDFLNAYAGGLGTDETFRKTFGVDYGTMQRQLKTYLRDGRYSTYSSRMPQTSKASEPFAVASPELVEIALAKLALGSNHPDLARKHAEAAVKFAPENAAAYDALACVQAEGKGAEPPITTLEKAIQLGSKDAWTYVLLADAKTRAALVFGGIPPAEARQIASLLEKAIELRPNLVTAYKQLVAALPEVEQISQEDIQWVLQGVKLYRDEGMLMFGLAQIAWKCGDKEKARKLLAEAIAHPGKMEPAALANARETEMRWLFDDTMENVKRLLDERKATEALGLIDKLLAQNLPPPARGILIGPRQMIVLYAKIEAAEAAVDAGRLNEARQLCDEVINAPQAPVDARNVAEQLCKRIGSLSSETSIRTSQ